jgi:hypothetical protein
MYELTYHLFCSLKYGRYLIEIKFGITIKTSSFPGGKARPGRDANHSPPSSADVKYEKELYLLSPHGPPWRVAGQLYLLPLPIKTSQVHITVANTTKTLKRIEE